MPEVFISYNHDDQVVARDLSRAIKEWQVNVWFDEWSLRPGDDWQETIEHAIQNTPVALVLWGPSGVGPWGKPEMRACLQQGVERGLIVVPVLMPGSPEKPDLPPFLSQRTWCDLRNGPSGKSFEQLLGVILDDAQPRREPEPIDKLVDTLIQLLSRRRDHKHDSDEFAALSTRIDPLVHEIQQRFRPERDSIVAGAKLIRVIGTGNFGTIWEGQTLDKKERVAVKIFRLERLAEGQMLARFRRSIRAMRLLNEEKRLAKLIDKRGAVARFGVADETGLAFSMEYLSGGNLEKVQLFGWDTARKIKVTLEVCAAVRFAHANGVIHRDIKPANIVLNDDSKPVLTDFDIADIKWATSLSTTVEGGLGTPVFAAPEQLEDADKADERADIYSLGRLLYFLLLERSPGYEIEKDPSLANLGGFSPALMEVIRRATQYAPPKRFATAAEFTRALEAVETGWARVGAHARQVRRWVQQNVAILVIMALVVGGAFGVAYSQSEQARIQAERALEQKEQKEQYAALANKLKNLSTRSDDIRKEKTRVEAHIRELKLRIPKLQEKERADAKKRLGEAQEKLQKLDTQEEELREDLEKLRRELDKMQATTSSGAVALSPIIPANVDLSRTFGKPNCKASEGCRKRGHCTEYGDTCIATTDGCLASEECNYAGYCVESGGKCIADADACKASAVCKLYGRCVESGGKCSADADSCRASEWCKQHGRCAESDGDCRQL